MDPLSEETSTKYFGVVTIAIVMPISLVVYHLSDVDTAISTFFFIGVIVFAAMMKRELRNKMWFWMTLLILTALQVPIIRNVHWPAHSVHGIVLLPMFVVDLLIVLGIIRLVEKIVDKSSPK
jgi:hypothetical protein